MLYGFSWIEPERVAGVGCPAVEDIDDLKAAGIGAILTLTESPLPEAFAEAGFEILHAPVVDFSAPSRKLLDRCVRWIDEQLAADRRVVVHCMAGRGRTGTVLAAWLAAHGTDPQVAIERIRTMRPGSIETRGQEEAVVAFAG